MIDEKKLIDDLKEYAHLSEGDSVDTIKVIIKIVEEQPKVDEWIPVTYHKTTEEDGVDKECYPFFLDCRLPDNGQEIIICMKNGYVCTDTSFDDDGCYLDSGIDWMDVIAWQPLPEPYKTKGE